MAYVNLKVGDVKGWDGKSEGLPPGEDYVLEVIAAEQDKSPVKGTPQLTLECNVLWPEAYEGRKTWARYFLLDNKGSRGRLRSIVDATGVAVDSNGGFDDQEFVGKIFVADVINEPYDKVDATTGTSVEKQSSKVVNERPYVPADEVPAAAPPPAEPAKRAAPPATTAPANAAPKKFGRPASSVTRVG